MADTTSRRDFFKISAAAGMTTLPMLLQGASSNAQQKRIVVVGGHPDDPECGVGGTVPLLIKAG